MRLRLSILLLAALTLCGCHKSETSALLNQAELTVMDDAPLALSLIEKADSVGIHHGEETALRNLIYTLACYRINDYPTNDSLITTVIDHYDNTSDKWHRMQAHFLRADQRHYNEDFPNAMADALIAYDLVIELDDDYWRAKAAEQIADCFASSQNFSEALPFQDEAIKYYRIAGKERNVLFALVDKADAIAFLGNTADGYNLIDSVYTISKQTSDNDLTQFCLNDLYSYHLNRGNYDKAYSLYHELETTDGFEPTAKNYADLANMLFYQNRPKEANIAISKSKSLIHNNYDLLSLYYTYIDHYRNIRDTTKYNETINLYVKILNEEVRNILKHPTISIQRNHLENKALKEQLLKERSIRTTIIITCILILILIVIICYTSYRIKIKNKEIEKQMEEVHGLMHKLSNTDVSQKELRNEIENLFKDQWTTLNLICNQYFEGPDDEINKTLILSEFKTHLSKLAAPKNLRQLEDSINKYMDNIILKLREECPSIKEQDITFLTLVLAGFSPKTICVFLNSGLKNVYAKRSRLIKKILSLETPSKKLFEEKLS